MARLPRRCEARKCRSNLGGGMRLPRFARNDKTGRGRNDKKRRARDDKTGGTRNGTFPLSLRGTIVPKQSRWGVRLPRFARNDETGRARDDKTGRARDDKTGGTRNDAWARIEIQIFCP